MLSDQYCHRDSGEISREKMSMSTSTSASTTMSSWERRTAVGKDLGLSAVFVVTGAEVSWYYGFKWSS